MNKKDKNKQFFSLDFDFDDIDFAEIGNKIKNSVNQAIYGLKSGFSYKNLPAIKDPNVCEQTNPIGPLRYTGLKILAGIFGITCIAIGLENLSLPPYGLLDLILQILIIGLGIVVPFFSWRIANNNKRLAINYDRFKRELSNSTIISIKDLASAVSQTEEATIKDLLYMMKQNYFKQARIVENDSIFILDIPTFKLYKDKLNSFPSSDKDELNDTFTNQSIYEINKQQAEDIIKNGDEILQKMNLSSSNIRDLSFKTDLAELFKNITDILNIVKRYPDKALSLNKFNDYYMPTSLKLIETFEEFELMNTDDKKIHNSMEEIKKSIKTIAEAFDNIKVDLLSYKAMDVKTDIDTINLIFKQEGLLEKDWSQNE